MNAVMSGQTVMSALIGHALAVDKSLNTLPMAIQMTATMTASIPAGIVFARLGRKPGFWLGCVGSLLGSLTFALGVWTQNFQVYCIGAIFAGLGFGIAQHLRFAAAEVAAAEARARAIALVMAGGVLAAIIGPEIVKRSNMLLPPLMFLGTYLCLTVLPLISATLLLFIQLPPAMRQVSAPVPFRTIIARPSFLTAVVCSMVGYGTMNLIMASTPLQMLFCGFGVNASADVIRAHSIAMFLPGFVTGRLIHRFGAHPIVCIGAVLTSLCVATNLLFPPLLPTFMVALMLLGVGWNFMFVGGTTLLATAHDPHERVRVQATNDFIVFGTVACTAFASGAIEATGGWAALNSGGRAADSDRSGAGDLALDGSRASGAGGGSIGRGRRTTGRPGGRGLADCVELANVAEQLLQERGLGARRWRRARHDGYRYRVVLVQLLHLLQHALIVEAQNRHVLVEDALDARDPGSGDLADIDPGVVVEGCPRGRRSDQRCDVGPGRSARHQFLELVGIHVVAAKLRLGLEEAAAADQQAGKQRERWQQGRRMVSVHLGVSSAPRYVTSVSRRLDACQSTHQQRKE